MKREYILTSERLGFRNWTQNDLPEFAAMNSDPKVMEHFPKKLTEEETNTFIARLQNHYKEHGYNYFATELLESGEFIGFIGLAYQTYETAFTPAIDLGWRLKKEAWGNGYATEGAQRCLVFAFDELKLDHLIATCTEKNLKSEKVMKKIGMEKLAEFDHPKLKQYPKYERCKCYKITRLRWQDHLLSEEK